VNGPVAGEGGEDRHTIAPMKWLVPLDLPEQPEHDRPRRLVLLQVDQELLIDAEEDPYLRAVLVGMLREGLRFSRSLGAPGAAAARRARAVDRRVAAFARRDFPAHPTELS
jgi:hypothetical protein